MVNPALMLDRDAEVPVGVQLAWILRAQIAAGELASGDRLPGARELATMAGVNPNTVRSVYARLEEEGLIEAQHGRGTFVSATPPREGVGDAVARAIDAAREAGIDPRELAAALYMHPSAPAARSNPAAERRYLREEIAALEQRLVVLEAPSVEARRSSSGSRLPSTAELRSIRDDLAARVATAETEDTQRRATAERRRMEAERDEPSVAGATAGRQRWELSLGHGRWTVPLTEG
jgi:DNA-binding transcriptional regulator YhcF (GntR family)